MVPLHGRAEALEQTEGVTRECVTFPPLQTEKYVEISSNLHFCHFPSCPWTKAPCIALLSAGLRNPVFQKVPKRGFFFFFLLTADGEV